MTPPPSEKSAASAEWEHQPDPDAPPRRSLGRRANRALVAGLVTLAVGTWLLSTRDWRPPEEPGTAVERRLAVGAWGLCKRVVTERLGAATVRFPWFDERAVRRVADSVFVVRASVDASLGARDVAGARTRIPFVCRTRWLGADRWLDEETIVRGR